MFSVFGDTVVDPFLGTGTTMKVAKDTHRNSIGYEIDEKLVPIIETRLSGSDSQKPSRRRKVVEGFQISQQIDTH
jgi:DNA modification methylase